jgi:hypothetical protein
MVFASSCVRKTKRQCHSTPHTQAQQHHYCTTIRAQYEHNTNTIRAEAHTTETTTFAQHTAVVLATTCHINIKYSASNITRTTIHTAAITTVRAAQATKHSKQQTIVNPPQQQQQQRKCNSPYQRNNTSNSTNIGTISTTTDTGNHWYRNNYYTVTTTGAATGTLPNLSTLAVTASRCHRQPAGGWAGPPPQRKVGGGTS